MRRLVYASVPQGDLKKILFPGGDEIQRPGYDGVTETVTGTEKVPAGLTYWEMGTDAKVKEKLDGDFNKRIKKRGKGDFSQVTYIATTPRDYTPKAKWAAQKTKLKKWKKVFVYDSDDLEQWLETVPSVALWLTRHLSLGQPEGIEDLSTHWDNLQYSLKAKVPPAALLVSRQGAAARFKQWLAGTPELLTVHGQTPQEVVDVFAAWVASLHQEEQEPIASRVIIVDKIEAWRALVDAKQHLVLVCSERIDVTPELLAEARRKGHHVLRPISSLYAESPDVLRLERMNRQELEKVLRDAGISEHEAYSFSQQCGGSFSILKRRLSNIPVQTAPKWGNSPDRDDLAPLLLAGAWADNNSGDRKIIAGLTKRMYEKAREVANRWQHEPDAPIWLAGGVWEFIAPLDAWGFLHLALSPSKLDLFEKAAIKVLGIDDPRLELSPEERFLATVKRKTLPYSSHLRSGIVRTLALVGTRGANEVPDTIPLATRADRVVRKILPITAKWTRWASLGSLLPLLAEAAPDAVLEAAEAGVRGDDPELSRLFGQEGKGFTGRAEHTGLLWALERLAWSPNNLPRVSIVLAKLAERDPGGQWANRPGASLRDVFFSWLPHTSAPLRQRLEVLELLVERHPDVGWKLLLALLPNSHESIMVHSTPEWQYWAEGWKREITEGEYRDTINGLVALALKSARENPERWTELIEEIVPLRGDALEQSVVALEGLGPAALSDQGREHLWRELAKIVAYHRSFPDAPWVLPTLYIERLEKTRDLLQPNDAVAVARPLFKLGYQPVGDHTIAWEKQEEIRRNNRIAALKAVTDRQGFDGLLRLIDGSDDMWTIGVLVAQSQPMTFESQILPTLLCCASKKREDFAANYVAQRAWTDRMWAENYPITTWSEAQQGAFLAQFTFERRTWDFVEKSPPSVQAEYWTRTRHVSVELTAEDAEFAAGRLIDTKRSAAATQVLWYSRKKDPRIATDVVLKLLERIAQTPPGDDRAPLDVYQLQELIRELQENKETNEGQLARIEWAFLEIFDERGLLPHTLHKLLSSDANFFYELLTILYRPHKQTRKSKVEADSDAGRRAQRVWRLIHNWNRLPGTQPDGRVDPDQLVAWVKRVRELANKGDRIAVCDITIGELFASSPEEDSKWPCLGVRRAFEEVESQELERGFETGIMNSRGAYMKSVGEGGKQERALAEKYEKLAKASTKWPRTAATLLSVATNYRRRADHEDEAARRQRM